MPHILEDGTSVFDGELDGNGKLAGFGTLARTTDSGVIVYEGEFLDGNFHGVGLLRFPNGTIYKASWERGAEVPGSGALQWEDGLVFNPQQGGGAAAAAADAAAGAAAPAAGGGGAPQPRIPGEEWGYLSSKDRRFWEEHVSGARAATSPQKREAQAQTKGGEAEGGP